MFCTRCGNPAMSKRYCTQCGADLAKKRQVLAAIAGTGGKQPYPTVHSDTDNCRRTNDSFTGSDDMEKTRRVKKGQEKLNEQMAEEIVYQVRVALEKAQREGRASSDITPENIVVQMSSGGIQIKVLNTGDDAVQQKSEVSLHAPTKLMKGKATSTLSNQVTVRVAPTPAITVNSLKPEPRGKSALLFLALLMALTGIVAGGLFLYVKSTGHIQAATITAQPALPKPTSEPVSLPVKNDAIWQTITDQTSGSIDVVGAVSKVDGRVVVIRPSGQIALNYLGEQPITDQAGADIHLLAPDQSPVSYLVFVRNNASEKWERIDLNRKGFVKGMACHDIGHHGIKQARQLMIKNNGTTDLMIDAVKVQ